MTPCSSWSTYDESRDLLFDTLFIFLDPETWLHTQITEQKIGNIHRKFCAVWSDLHNPII